MNRPPSSLNIKCWARQKFPLAQGTPDFDPQTQATAISRRLHRFRDSSIQESRKQTGRHQFLYTGSYFMCLHFVFHKTHGTLGQKGKGYKIIYRSSLFTYQEESDRRHCCFPISSLKKIRAQYPIVS